MIVTEVGFDSRVHDLLTAHYRCSYLLWVYGEALMAGVEKRRLYIMLYWGVDYDMYRGSIAAYSGTALALHNYLRNTSGCGNW